MCQYCQNRSLDDNDSSHLLSCHARHCASALHDHISASEQPSELGAIIISIFQGGETEGQGGYVACPRSVYSVSGEAAPRLRCDCLGAELHLIDFVKAVTLSLHRYGRKTEK